MKSFGDLPGEETRGYLATTGAFAAGWSSAALSPRNKAMHALSKTTL